MKKLLLLLIFISIYQWSFGQDDIEASFLEKIIRENQPEGQIIYTDKISKSDLGRIKNKINTYIYNKVSNPDPSYITLTRQEKKYLTQQLENCCWSVWKEDLFKNSKIVKEEETINYIKSSYSDYLEKYNNPSNSEEDKMTMVKNYQRPTVFKFTKPIYFRENTLFFFYFSTICGTPCGFEEIYIYKKENTAWKKWILVDRKDY
jgi:hypothetical protein